MLSDVAELRTFQRILALGSLSAAGRDLGVGLAVVSKRLASLERRAGVRLVNRTTRSLSPTEEGLALLGHVERVLDELDAAEAQLASGRETPFGVLRVSAPISFGRIYLAPVAAELTARNRRLDVDLRLDDRLIDMVEGRIDLAIRIGEPRDSAAVMRKLADNHRILVAAPAYLARRGRPRTPDELAVHDLLRFGEGLEPWRLEGPGGEAAEVDSRPRLRADNGDVIQAWALAGHGVMLKSELDVADELRTGALERVLPDWRSRPAPVYALTPAGRHVPTKTRVFLEALTARLKSGEP
ncbi:LysR family transcriptional regulator [Phenylobacterium sp.]|uniref:LysR family transcriptional regulator n=1 Tax=Phenylobacterium sp. TaxID=1871053 RepID=UPI0035B34996